MEINISHTDEERELNNIHTLLLENLKPYEVVSLNDFKYYVKNYHKIYHGEKYIAYKIDCDGELIGALTGLILNEFIFMDYLVVTKKHRKLSKEIFGKIKTTLSQYNKPIVIESETENLCRLYQILGFNRFNEPYKYHTLTVDFINKKSYVNSYNSNLMYLNNKKMDFETTKKIVYEKYYLRWNNIYTDYYLKEYKEKIYNQ